MPNPLNAFLASNLELRQLSSKAKQLTSLQRHYELIVPPSLKNNSRVLQLRQQELFIAADNGAVASKLRQMAAELLSLFQARGCEVTGIQIKVQVRNQPRTIALKPRKLGSAAHQALTELDKKLGDSPLKAALSRLARRS